VDKLFLSSYFRIAATCRIGFAPRRNLSVQLFIQSRGFAWGIHPKNRPASYAQGTYARGFTILNLPFLPWHRPR
jgi:hypothetical protein